MLRERLGDPQLGRADVGDDHALPARLERFAGQSRQRRDRPGAEDGVGAGDRLGHRVRGGVDRADVERPRERRRVAIEARDLGAEPARGPRARSIHRSGRLLGQRYARG